MSKQQKLLTKLLNSKNTFTWDDLVTLLNQLGYKKEERSGSRVLFSRGLEHDLHLHKPHPENIIKGGALKAVKLHLKQEGYL